MNNRKMGMYILLGFLLLAGMVSVLGASVDSSSADSYALKEDNKNVTEVQTYVESIEPFYTSLYTAFNSTNDTTLIDTFNTKSENKVITTKINTKNEAVATKKANYIPEPEKIKEENDKVEVKNTYDMSSASIDSKMEALKTPVSNPKGSNVIPVEATAYVATCKGCSGITYTELDIRYSTPPIIAVDPKIIPLGSLVELWVSGYYWGDYRAEDIGGGIKGNEIDVLFANEGKAYDFGRREDTVVIIKEVGTYDRKKNR